MASPEGTLRLPYLDGLRALAATYVVMFHAVQGFSAPSLTGPWRLLCRAFAYGHEAVAIFIVLSGYCLMLPVVRRQAGLSVPFVKFMWRRAVRILPPYFLALALSLALIASSSSLRVGHTGTIWDDCLPGLQAGPVASHLLLVHNWVPAWTVQINGPLWSVATEWQIYFFFPLLLLPVWRRAGMLAALAAAVAVGYAPLLLAPSSAKSAIPWYLVLFMFGMMAAAVGFPAEPSGPSRNVRWGLLSAVGWALCFVLSSAAPRLWFNSKPLTDPLIGASTAALLVHLTARATGPTSARGRLLRLLDSRPLVGLGHFSYSLYLTHLPVMAVCYFALRSLGWTPEALALLLLLLGSLLSLLVAYAFHLAFERPFLVRR